MSDQISRLNAALEDRYLIERQLGEGGMATVYLAEDVRHARKVAIKVLKPDLAAVMGGERFLAEIRTTANLRHPHILPLFDSGESDGMLYYVMPYVEGESLRARLDRDNELPIEDAVRIAAETAAALDHAHGRGVIHRDIKPANILLDEGRALVADFGIALAVEHAGGTRLTEAGLSLGTPLYMSPEQATGGRKVDPRSDVYALGCVVYEMLTGEPPFTGPTARAILAKILTDDPEPVARRRRAVPPHVARIVMASIEKLPADRPQSAAALRTALETPAAARSAAPRPTRAILVTAVLSVAFTGAVAYALAGRGGPGAATPLSGLARPLTASGDAWNVALSPDGETVAYLTSDGLVTQDVSGGRPNALLGGWVWGPWDAVGAPAGQPWWLLDGSAVAYVSQLDPRRASVHAVPRMGGDPRPLFTTYFETGEFWSQVDPLPDGGALLARVIEVPTSKPWLRIRRGDAETGIEVPEEFMRLWDAAPSPDGRWIAYIGERADRSTALNTVSADGGRHEYLLDGGQELGKWPDLSLNRVWPANRTLRWRQDDRILIRRVTGRGVELLSIPVDQRSGRATGEPRTLISGLPWGASFDVSVDGRRLVYSGGTTRTQIQLFRFDPVSGGEPVERIVLTSGTARHVAPRFSPDGTRIAYVRQMPGAEEIFVEPLDGGDPEPVRTVFEWDRIIDLKWGPSGERLALFVEREGTLHFAIVSLDGSDVLELPSVPGGTWFSWSPDGRRLAYESSDDTYYFIYDLETGTEVSRFEEDRDEYIHSVFSPDGSQLIVNRTDPSTLLLQSVTTAENRAVADKAVRAYVVHWSPDDVLTVLDADGSLSRVSIESGETTSFGTVPAECVWEGWAQMSPDGRWLACAVDERRESDVWVIDLQR